MAAALSNADASTTFTKTLGELASVVLENRDGTEPDALAQKVDWTSSKAMIYIQNKKGPTSEILKYKGWTSISYTNTESQNAGFSCKFSSGTIDGFSIKKVSALQDNANKEIAELKVGNYEITLTQHSDGTKYCLKVDPKHNFAEVRSAEGRCIMYMTKAGSEWKIFIKDEKALSQEAREALIALVVDNYSAAPTMFNLRNVGICGSIAAAVLALAAAVS